MCLAWRPDVVLVLKGGPITPELIHRVKARTDALFLNLFPDNPLWMIPFEHIEPYDLFFTKERYAMRQLRLVGLRNLHYLPLYCVPVFQHPVALTPEEPRPSPGSPPWWDVTIPIASASCENSRTIRSACGDLAGTTSPIRGSAPAGRIRCLG